MKTASVKKSEGVAITLRPDAEDLEILKEFAETNHTSINSIVKHAIKDYIQWDLNIAKAGWVVIPHVALKELINIARENDIEKIIKIELEHHKTILSLITGKHDLDAILIALKGRVKKSGFKMQISEKNEGEILILLQHNMGAKWSSLFARVYDQILQNMGFDHKVEFSEDANSIKIYKR